MKILFFGLGSIGLRHAKILLKNYKHQLFAFRSGKDSAKNNLEITEIFTWEEAEKLKPDIAFITNPTFLHIETAIRCAKLGCKLFIEKPIGKDIKKLDLLIKLVKKNNLVSFVGYNLRFHPVIEELKKYTEKQMPIYARVVCSSYLPDWRPGIDYKKNYSANSSMGGGVLLDLSHEIDYVNYLLGDIKDISGKFGKVGNITVDAEDYADLLIKTAVCQTNIHINFLSHLRQRYIQLEFGDMTIVGNLINAEIIKYQNHKLKQRRALDYYQGQEYESQLEYFLSNLDNPNMMNNLAESSVLFKKIIAFKK